MLEVDRTSTSDTVEGQTSNLELHLAVTGSCLSDARTSGSRPYRGRLGQLPHLPPFPRGERELWKRTCTINIIRPIRIIIVVVVVVVVAAAAAVVILIRRLKHYDKCTCFSTH